MRAPALSLCLMLFSVSLPILALGDEKVSTTEAPLSGRYRFASGEKNGGESPEESLKDSRVSITAKEIIATDKANNQTYVATYTLDTSKKPWHISMESLVPTIGAKSTGLVSLEGETLKIIYALPGGEAPTEFKTKEKQHMWVLQAEPNAPANKAKAE